MDTLTEISVTPCAANNASDANDSLSQSRRNSPSKLEALKECVIATGANFRPPFTPSNSLMSPPPSKAKLRRAKAMDILSISSIQKVQTIIPETSSHYNRSQHNTYKDEYQSDFGSMRSSSLRPNKNREHNGTPNSGVLTNQYSLRASSSNVSDSSFSTQKSNKRFAHVKSRIDANNIAYTPSASQIRIFHNPVRVKAQPRVGSLANASHVPAGGNVKIEHHKLSFKNGAKPRIDAKSNVEIPKSDKKIPSQKLSWRAESRVGSLANANHKPAGGNVKIFHQPLRLEAVQSKVGSLDNADHVPGGGNVKISEYNVQGALRRSSSSHRIDSRGSSRRSSTSATAFHRVINGTAQLRI